LVVFRDKNQNGSCDLNTEEEASARLVSLAQNSLLDRVSQSVHLLRSILIKWLIGVDEF